ncbi:MAG: hypothetical protein JNK05_39450 [Myxococcales bacterium]|nr:hypothetical protein [Myxococcales bacterium]
MSDPTSDFVSDLFSPLLALSERDDAIRDVLQYNTHLLELSPSEQEDCIAALNALSNMLRDDRATRERDWIDILSAVTRATNYIESLIRSSAVRVVVGEVLEQLLVSWLGLRQPLVLDALFLLGVVIVETIAVRPAGSATVQEIFVRRFRIPVFPVGRHWTWRDAAVLLNLPDGSTNHFWFAAISRLSWVLSSSRRIQALQIRSTVSPELPRHCTTTISPPFGSVASWELDIDAVDDSDDLRVSLLARGDVQLRSRIGNAVFEIGVSGAGAQVQILPNLLLPATSLAIAGVARVALSPDAQRPRLLICREAMLVVDEARLELAIESTVIPIPSLTLSTTGVVRSEIRIDLTSPQTVIAALLFGRSISAPFFAAVTWKSGRGLDVDAGAGIEFTSQINRSVGPIRIQALTVSLKFSSRPPSVAGAVALRLAIQIGPLHATFHGLGAGIKIESTQGNLGNFLIAPTIYPFKQIDAVIRTAVVSGSGSLQLDPPNRYLGSLTLTATQVAIRASAAVAAIEDGNAYSVIASLFATFPSLPLGMGFFLRGIGGLVGIHRAVSTSRWRSLIRSGHAGAVLFPRLPHSGSSESSSRLDELIPLRAGRYSFGPAVRIDYGAAGLALAEFTLAILVELPSPLVFALVGSAEALLPQRELPVVELHIDLVGIVDAGQREISIDASLNNSRIGPLELFGDLAFRLGWGEQPYFLLSIGGFNPHFQAPSNFPTLRRLTLGYTAPGGLVRLRIESYFAITSNTLQLGARIEVQVRVEIASIDGMLAFDALVIFSPFSFRIDFLASLSVTVFGAKLLAIHLEGTIKGPKPWHVTGKARLSVLFIEAAVDVDVKFGGEPSLEELPAVDPTDRLLDALRAPASWKGELMPGVSRPVSLSDASSSETPLFDPVGVPAVRQTIVPLNRKLDRFAEGRIGGPGRYDIRAARVGTASATQRPAHELFAAAQFEQMSDAEKLSRPSFEKMDAGALLASDAISVGPKSQGAGLFEQIKLGDDETPTTATLPREQLLASSRSGASSLRGLRVQGSDRFAPPVGSAPRVALADELYVAVRRDSLQPAERSAPETAGAASALVQWLAEESGGASLFQVAPAFEVTGGESR